MALSRCIQAVLVAFGFVCPLLVAGASCGTVGSLLRNNVIQKHQLSRTTALGLVLSCQQMCLDSETPCLGFVVNKSAATCDTLSKTMETQGMIVSENHDVLHYDMSCFDAVARTSSTKTSMNLTAVGDSYTCTPGPGQAVFNPSFEDGIWVGFAHGWSFHASSEENKPQRSATGSALEGNTNMVFEVKGTGTSAISQRLCLVPRLKYQLSAYIGHVSDKNIFGAHEIYYYAPTLSVYLDRDLIFRNSVCGAGRRMRPTQCHPNDGSYYPISVIIEPLRATPNLTFEFTFNAPKGKRSYKGLLDLVQVSSAEPPI